MFTLERVRPRNAAYDTVRRIDEDPTGLLNEGFRYRGLETGVFLTADPFGKHIMMPQEKWMVDGKEVSMQEYQAALNPGIPQGGNGPTKSAKDVAATPDGNDIQSRMHTAAAGFPNLYTYVNQNPWTFFDPEGLITVGFEGYGAPTWSGGTKDTQGNVDLRNYVADHGGKDFSRSQAGQAKALEAVKAAIANGDKTVNVYGFSRGGVAANDFAKKLQKAGISVDHLTIIDPVNLTVLPYPAHLTVPDNVKKADVYWQNSGGPFQGGAAKPGKNVTNHDISGEKGAGPERGGDIMGPHTTDHNTAPSDALYPKPKPAPKPVAKPPPPPPPKD